MKTMRYVWLMVLMLMFFTDAAADNSDISPIKIDTDAPLLFQADRIEHNEKTGLVTASGNVEVQDKQTTLLADKLVYDQNTKIIKAYGNIRILTPEHHTLFAEYGEISDDLNDAFVKSVKLRMSDDSRMIALVADRKNGDITIMKKAVFSPCPLCKKNPHRAPVWQLKSHKVIHKGKQKDIIYNHAQMEVYGVPVFYFPYFRHPDPSVKRRTGILAPSIGNDKELGVVTGVPLFIVLGKDKDITVTPYITSKTGFLGSAQYNQHFGAGLFQLDASGTTSKPTEKENSVDVVQKEKRRGHVHAQANFDLPRPLFGNETSIGFDVLRATDQTYVRRYSGIVKIPIENHNTHHSKVYFNDIGQNGFLSARAYSFYGTRVTDNNKRIPNALPNFNYIHTTDPGSIGQYWTFETNNIAVHREIGTKTNRASFDGTFSVPYLSPLGDEYVFSAAIIADGYTVDQSKNAVGTQTKKSSYEVARVMPRLSVDWRYPLLCIGNYANLLIEPILNYTMTTDLDEKKEKRIPNEDSQFEFDEINVLFSNRFSGRDRLDAGRRTSAGVNIETRLPHGVKAAFFIGQSYFSSNKSDLLRESGADDHFSDYVGRFLVSLPPFLQASYRFRYDRMNFKHKRSIATLSGGIEKISANVSYLFSANDKGSHLGKNIHQAKFGAVSNLNKNWSVELSTLQDFANDPGPLEHKANISWHNECTRVDFSIKRKYFKDRDIKPGTTALVTVTFKHLGSVNTGALTPIVDQDGEKNAKKKE